MRLREFTEIMLEQILAIHEADSWILMENAGSVNDTVFFKSPMYDETMAQFPGLHDKIRQFMDLKQQKYDAPFGSNDKAFLSGLHYTRQIPDLRKAHLSADESLVYRFEGKNPRKFYLFGVFNHHTLGTSDTQNRNRQKSMAKQLGNIQDPANFQKIPSGSGKTRPVQEQKRR